MKFCVVSKVLCSERNFSFSEKFGSGTKVRVRSEILGQEQTFGLGENFGLGVKFWVRVKILMGAKIWVGRKGAILLFKFEVKNLHLSTYLHRNSHGVSVFSTKLISICGFITKSVFSNFFRFLGFLGTFCSFYMNH